MDRNTLLLAISASLLVLITFACSCSSGNPEPSLIATSQHAVDEDPGTPAFPSDRLQPWELESRELSSILPGSEILPGREWHLASPAGVTENGEAARLQSTSSASAHVIYRMQLDAQPGIVAADVNLLGKGSYYIGIADFGRSRWKWHGPFHEVHVRIAAAVDVRAGADYLSGLGNMFVAVLVAGGDSADIVALGAETLDPSDMEAPLQPGGLDGQPHAAALLLEWNDNGEPDLGGYLVHYSNRAFISPASAGVRTWPAMQGSPLVMLPASQKTYIRVSAVDFSGNASAASELLELVPLPGQAPDLLLQAGQPSGGITGQITLTATGADEYDWDLDGDGNFEVSGDGSGIQQAYTDRMGIIRPRVRGSIAGGAAVALGSVSLLISGNSRPVAVATAAPASGTAPLLVDFAGSDSTDFDGDIVGGGWDFDGDGTYDIWDDTDILHVTSAQFTYEQPGTYNAKLRVVDNDGSWDVDTVAINVMPGPGNQVPVAGLSADPPSGEKGVSVLLDASASADPDGSIADYEWDLDYDGLFNEAGDEADNQGNPAVTQLYPSPGEYLVRVRVTDNDGGQSLATTAVEVRGWAAVEVSTPGGEEYGWPSLAVVGGRPVMAFLKTTVPKQLFYAWSSSPHGSLVQDWDRTVITDQDGTGFGVDLISLNGHPALAAYSEDTEVLTYGYSATTGGTDQGDWTFVTVDDDDTPTGGQPTMAVVNGRPAVCYAQATLNEVHYAWSSTAEGTSSEDWNHIRISPEGDVCVYSHLQVVDGHPATPFFNISTGLDLWYARSTDPEGHDPGDWVSFEADTTFFTGRHPWMAIVNGYPAITHYDSDLDQLHYVISNTRDGMDPADWSTPVVFPEAGDKGDYSAIVNYMGLPRIFYYDRDEAAIRMASSSTQYGTDVDDWDLREVDAAADADVTGIDAMIVNGRLAIAFRGVDLDVQYRVLID